MTRRGKAHMGIVYQYYLHEGELSQRHVPRRASRSSTSSPLPSPETDIAPPEVEPEVLPQVTEEDTDLFI